MIKLAMNQKINQYKLASTKHLKDADSIIKTLAMLDPFLDQIEDVKSDKMYRQSLKHAGNLFEKELIKSIGVIYKTDDATQSQARMVMNQIDELDNLITNTHVSKFPDLIKVLKAFHEFEGASVDVFVKHVVQRQYATFYDYVLPKNIMNTLVKKYPSIDFSKTFLTSLVNVLKRSDFSKNTEAIIDDVFSNAGLKW